MCRHDGEVVEGHRAVNGAAVAIHCAVHAARPDILAAAHAHGPFGKTLSSLEMTVEPLTQDACASTTTSACTTRTPAWCSTPLRDAASVRRWATTRR